MRRMLHIFLVFAVLWCGIHVGEPAMAHDQTLHHQLDAQDGHSDIDGGAMEEGVLDAAHSGHHHCPMAADTDDGLSGAGNGRDDGLLFTRAVSQLKSRSQAPPLEPPAA